LSGAFRSMRRAMVVSGRIEIPHTQIAKEVGVDRRVVDATTEMILGDEILKRVFMNIHSIASFKDVAPLLGLGVIIITPDNAQNIGILSDVTSVVSMFNLSIRQAVTDDPFLLTSLNDRHHERRHPRRARERAAEAEECQERDHPVNVSGKLYIPGYFIISWICMFGKLEEIEGIIIQEKPHPPRDDQGRGEERW